jgi:hypothetical protein
MFRPATAVLVKSVLNAAHAVGRSIVKSPRAQFTASQLFKPVTVVTYLKRKQGGSGER